MRKVLVTPILAGVTGLAALAPATALAANNPTIVGLTVSGGALTIDTPLTATLTATIPAATIATGPLGTVTVSDSSGVAGWHADAGSSAFSTTGGVTKTIPATAVSYTVGVITPNLPADSANYTTPTDSTSIATSRPVVVAALLADTGATSASWNPTITVALAGATNGIYSGTIIHSVA